MKQIKISAVINTYNEEKNIGRCLDSVKDFADEIVVVDMYSSDKTLEIAKKYGAKIYHHEYTRYVEPARNFAISKASDDWIFLIDADEELTPQLAKSLKIVAENDGVGYVEIPRKNIIFGKWIEHSRWWPDYLIKFFKKGKIKFSNKIHVPPQTLGVGRRLEATEGNALIHHNFQSVAQFVDRLNRYTDIQAEELQRSGYNFDWKDLLIRPSNEFFSRFFAGEGYKDGLHGLVLAILQAFSELVVYLKVWEQNKFKGEDIKDLDKTTQKIISDFLFWQRKTAVGFFKKIRLRIKGKI